MAGTYRGRIDCLINEADEFLNAGVAFKNAYDVLQAHPTTTRIALGYGAGTGTDYPGGANPFGNGAFCVYRFDTAGARTFPFYVFLGVSGVTSGAAASSFNAQVDGGNGSASVGQVYVSAAVGVGGDENPWNGTENNDGTDTVPTTFWAAPGGGGTNVQALPASNSTSGNDGTNKNNCLLWFDQTSPGQAAMSVVCDDDGMTLLSDPGNTGAWIFVHLGYFTPNQGLASYPAPLVAWKRAAGSTVNLSSAQSQDLSGVTDPDQTVGTWEAAPVRLTTYDLLSSTYLPNDAESTFDAYAIGIASAETTVAGFRGETRFAQVTYGIAAGDTDLGQDLFVSGPGTTASVKELTPWDGATTPGTTATRAGVDFTRVP